MLTSFSGAIIVSILVILMNITGPKKIESFISSNFILLTFNPIFALHLNQNWFLNSFALFIGTCFSIVSVFNHIELFPLLVLGVISFLMFFFTYISEKKSKIYYH
jgi:hypothetical protein